MVIEHALLANEKMFMRSSSTLTERVVRFRNALMLTAQGQRPGPRARPPVSNTIAPPRRLQIGFLSFSPGSRDTIIVVTIYTLWTRLPVEPHARRSAVAFGVCYAGRPIIIFIADDETPFYRPVVLLRLYHASAFRPPSDQCHRCGGGHGK